MTATFVPGERHGPSASPWVEMSQEVHTAYQFRARMLSIPDGPMALYGDGGDGHHDHQLRDDETLILVLMAAPLDGESAAYLQAISHTLAEGPMVEAVVRLGVGRGRSASRGSRSAALRSHPAWSEWRTCYALFTRTTSSTSRSRT